MDSRTGAVVVSRNAGAAAGRGRGWGAGAGLAAGFATGRGAGLSGMGCGGMGCGGGGETSGLAATGAGATGGRLTRVSGSGWGGVNRTLGCQVHAASRAKPCKPSESIRSSGKPLRWGGAFGMTGGTWAGGAAVGTSRSRRDRFRDGARDDREALIRPPGARVESGSRQASSETIFQSRPCGDRSSSRWRAGPTPDPHGSAGRRGGRSRFPGSATTIG